MTASAPRLRFSLLGHPVRHSVSPSMCTAAFAALGLPHVYTAIDVPSPAGLGRIADDLRSGVISGCNVTLPYKRAVLDHADAQAESAVEAGAANVLTVDHGRVVAHNTDAEALARELEDLSPETAATPRPRLRAAIIGSGGAALAALVACRRLGFRIVSMTSRSWTDTEAMFESPAAQRARTLGALTAPWPARDEAVPGGNVSQALRLQWGELVAHSDCVIQATSAGMEGADPGEDVSAIVPWDSLPAHALVYDVVYTPRDTPFLRAAQARGLTAAGGLGMLVRQAALSIALWTGKTPPLDRLRRAAEEALAARHAGR
jgi:shikimate dehydrogenase